MGNRKGSGWAMGQEEDWKQEGKRRVGEGRGQPGDDRKRRNPGNKVATPKKKKRLEKLNNDNCISLSNSELG